MEKYEKIKRADFLRRTGVNHGDFISILLDIDEYIEKDLSLMPLKKRGRKSSISLPDKVLLFFYYLRHYPTFIELGEQFDISESYAHKIYHNIGNVMVYLKNIPNRKILLEGDLSTILIDVTEQQIERPLKKQKQYYSGKKKKHTIKVQLIICAISLKILSVWCEKGTVHDFKIFKNSKLSIAKQILILADSGYQGIEKIHANSKTPHKKTKKKSLTISQKKENKELSKQRILIEHINRRCKIFRITKEVYRGKHKNYSKVWNIISGIVNIRYAA